MKLRLRGSVCLLSLAALFFWPLLVLLMSAGKLPGAVWGGNGYSQTFLVSVAYAFATTVIALTFAAPMAIGLFKMKCPGRDVIIALVVAGAMTPLYVYAAAWIGLFDLPSGGLLQTSETLPVNSLWSRVWNAALINGCAKASLAVLLMGLSLLHHRTEEEEAAWLDTSRAGVFFHVVMRQMAVAFVFAGTIIAGVSFGEIAVTDMLAVRTLAEEMYTQFQLTLDPLRASVSGIGIFLPILVPIFAVLALRGSANVIELDSTGRSASSVFTSHPKALRWVLTAVMLTIIVWVTLVPLGALLLRLPNATSIVSKIITLAPELGFSLSVALTASALAVAITLGMTLGLRRSQYESLAPAVAFAGLFVPGCLVGISLVRLLNRQGIAGHIYDSSLILVIAQAIRVLPLTYLAMSIFGPSRMSAVEDLSALDGPSIRESLLQIHLPLLMRPLVLTWALSFAWCLGELDASIIVCPPGTTTLPIRLFTMMHYGIYADVAVACLALYAFVFASAGFLLLARRWTYAGA